MFGASDAPAAYLLEEITAFRRFDVKFNFFTTFFLFY